MAVGDAVVGIITTANTVYQPSSVVEVCITALGANNSGNAWNLYNGTSSSQIDANSNNCIAIQHSAPVSKSPLKLFITNSVYLLTGGNPVNYAYSGIQTK